MELDWPALLRKARVDDLPSPVDWNVLAPLEKVSHRCARCGEPCQAQAPFPGFEGYLNVSDYSRLSGQSPATVRRHFKKGILRGRQKANGPIYILKSELLDGLSGPAAHE